MKLYFIEVFSSGELNKSTELLLIVVELDDLTDNININTTWVDLWEYKSGGEWRNREKKKITFHRVHWSTQTTLFKIVHV